MALTPEKLQNAINWSKENPESTAATELRRRIESGAYNEQLSQMGVDTSRFVATREAETFEQGEPQGFLGKARDFATSLIGGGELARGAGLALAAPEIQRQQEQQIEQLNEQQTRIIQELQEARQAGEDTSRLERALSFNQSDLEALGQEAQSFGEQLPTTKQVVGSSARLAGTAALGPVAKGFSNLFKAGRATGALSRGVRGIGAGAATGVAEGAIQGAGAAAEQDQTAGEIATSGVLGGIGGGVLGGGAGFAVGAGTRALGKFRSMKAQRNQLLEQGAQDTRAARFFKDAQGNIQKDPVASEAIKQGVDEGTVALVKGANESTRSKLRRMLERRLAGATDKRRALLERPAGVAGESAVERFNTVSRLNREAARQLDDVAQGLKGQSVDPTAPVQEFVESLEDSLGVTFRNGKPDFSDSLIDGLDGPQRVVERVVNRMRNTTGDAFEIHKLKRFIDEQVKYGKTSEGLTGAAEVSLKRLRASLDELLDNNFSQYNQVNTQFSDTRKAIDAFGDVAGKTFDPSNPSVDENAGQLLRRITGQARSRTDVIDSLQLLQDTAEKYGATFDDDLITQVDFFTELERLFGSQAPTSFLGQAETAARRGTEAVQSRGGLIDLGIRAAGGAVRAGRDINEEALERSLKELLQ